MPHIMKFTSIDLIYTDVPSDNSYPAARRVPALDWFYANSGLNNNETWIDVTDAGRILVKDLPFEAADWYVGQCVSGKKAYVDLTNENVPKIVMAYNQELLLKHRTPEQRLLLTSNVGGGTTALLINRGSGDALMM